MDGPSVFHAKVVGTLPPAAVPQTQLCENTVGAGQAETGEFDYIF